MDFQLRMGQNNFFIARAPAFGLPTVTLIFALTMLPLCSALSASKPSLSSAKTNLKSGDLKRKYEAIAALPTFASREAGDALAETLRTETDTSVQLAILDSLAAMHDPRQTPAIAPLLRSPRPGLRQRAALTLGVIGGAEAETDLAGALAGEQDPVMKNTLLRGLALCGTEKSATAVSAALSDSRPEVRHHAIDALERIPGPEALRALRSHQDHDARIQERKREAIARRKKWAN